jgi:hypothetical protein
MALPIDVTDPGSTNAETQAFGLGLPLDVTPGSDVAEQFSSASVTNLGISRVGGPPSTAVPGLGVRVDVDPGDDVAEQATSATPLTTVFAGGFKPGTGVETTSNDPGMTNVESQNPVGLGLPPLVQGGTFSPSRVPTDITQNNVAGQVYGTGTPINVKV